MPSQFSNPAKPIEAESDKLFVITLESNRTTGYQWQLAGRIDDVAVELVGVEYVKPRQDMPGAGGVENWTFRAKVSRREKVMLPFKYVRPWEKNSPPAKEEVFSVIIRKGERERQLDSMQKELNRLHDELWTEHLGQ